MPQYITHQMLDQALAKHTEELKLVFATKQDILDVEGRITEKFSTLQSSVDEYLGKTETWHQEQEVLAMQHDRLQNSLIRKNVITEEEIVS